MANYKKGCFGEQNKSSLYKASEYCKGQVERKKAPLCVYLPIVNVICVVLLMSVHLNSNLQLIQCRPLLLLLLNH